MTELVPAAEPPEPTESTEPAEATELAELRAANDGLRAENDGLRARLDTRQRRSAALLTLRRATAAVLAAVAAFALVGSVIGLWAANTTLNTDRWVATVAPLPQNKAVAAAVAQYASGEVFNVLDVEDRIRTVLPQQAGFVARALATPLRGVVRNTGGHGLRSDA